MAVSADYLAYVLEQLARVDGLSSRRMFGAAGLYSHECFFGLIAEDTLYLRVDDANRAVLHLLHDHALLGVQLLPGQFVLHAVAQAGLDLRAETVEDRVQVSGTEYLADSGIGRAHLLGSQCGRVASVATATASTRTGLVNMALS